MDQVLCCVHELTVRLTVTYCDKFSCNVVQRPEHRGGWEEAGGVEYINVMYGLHPSIMQVVRKPQGEEIGERLLILTGLVGSSSRDPAALKFPPIRQRGCRRVRRPRRRGWRSDPQMADLDVFDDDAHSVG